MEKLEFETEDGKSEFYVIEQTRLNETDYLLVSESPEEDAEVLIMKEVSGGSGVKNGKDESGTGRDKETEEAVSIYELVTDENELTAVFRIFEELMDE